MIRGWAKSLLFDIFVGVLFLFLCVQCVNASGIGVTTPDSVIFSFGPSTEATKMSSFRITNTALNTTTIDISCTTPSGIQIKPSKTNFDLAAGASQDIYLTITVDTSKTPEREYPPYSCTITVDSNAGRKSVEQKVAVIYNAKIEVNPPSINFGEVHQTDKPSRTITISEIYGYKNVNISIAKSGNEWLKIDKAQIQIKKGSTAQIVFTLTPGTPDHNLYSWSFSLSSTTSNTQISQNRIQIEAYILMPAKLGELDDEELKIKFDKPWGTKPEYERSINVGVRNEGDEPMHFKSTIHKPRAISMEIIGLCDEWKVEGKRKQYITIRIIAPYSASEGTHSGRLEIDAGDAGQGNANITIAIIWPVDFNISSDSDYFTPSPPYIDFGSLELKERGYEKREMNLTITETYLYKPVQNLRFSGGKYDKWVKGVRNFSVIPPGESRNITVKIEPGLEAVPKDYSWNCDLSASEIKAKNIGVKAKIVPMNISMMIDGFTSFRDSLLYTNYPSTEAIISNGVEILEVAAESEIGKEDWEKIPILTKGALSLLSSLNDASIYTEEKTYGKAVESLLIASVSLSSIDSNSDLYIWALSDYAQAISAGADMTTGEVMKAEAKMLELRGWDIKNAVKHAEAMGNIRGLTDDENVLEAALSYQYAARVYGLLSDKEKRLGCVYEKSILMDRHDELVSDANDLRLDVEIMILDSKEKDFIRIWDLYLLLNPYNYDTASANYWLAQRKLDDASKKYRVAGELLMAKNTKEELYELKGEWSYILSLFILVCLLYAAVLIYTIGRIFIGTMAYMKDMHDREVGDIVVTYTSHR